MNLSKQEKALHKDKPSQLDAQTLWNLSRNNEDKKLIMKSKAESLTKDKVMAKPSKRKMSGGKCR